MTKVTNNNLKIQVDKTTLDDILDSKRFHIELLTSKYWIKQLLDIKLEDDKLVKTLKTIKTISISNGMHKQLPVYTYSCLRYFVNDTQDKFIFQLGKKLKENIPQIKTKPKVIKQLNLFD
jgi:hypothetical protein